MLVSETMWFFGPFPTHPKPLVAAPAPLAAILFTPHRAAGGISALTLHRTAFFVHSFALVHHTALFSAPNARVIWSTNRNKRLC